MYKIVLYLLLILVMLLSCNSPRADKNYENLRQIKNGMHIKEVLSIMGKPDTIITKIEKSDRLWYMYKSSAGMSDNFYIYVSKKDSLVVGINEGN